MPKQEKEYTIPRCQIPFPKPRHFVEPMPVQWVMISLCLGKIPVQEERGRKQPNEKHEGDMTPASKSGASRSAEFCPSGRNFCSFRNKYARLDTPHSRAVRQLAKVVLKRRSSRVRCGRRRRSPCSERSDVGRSRISARKPGHSCRRSRATKKNERENERSAVAFGTPSLSNSRAAQGGVCEGPESINAEEKKGGKPRKNKKGKKRSYVICS